MDENADKKPGQEPEVKKVEHKDLIGANIQKRAEEDFSQMKKEVYAVLCKYLPSRRGEWDSVNYLSGPQSPIATDFFKTLEPVAMEYFKEKREKDFNNILTNLGSYLEMVNH